MKIAGILVTVGIIGLVLFAAIYSNMQQNESTKTNILMIPKEGKVIRNDEGTVYLQIGKRYYIRVYHGGHAGYSVYEVDKEIVLGNN